MVEKNLKKLQAKKRRVTNGFNTGTRDMKLKTAYRRSKRWSADSQDVGHRHYLNNYLSFRRISSNSIMVSTNASLSSLADIHFAMLI